MPKCRACHANRSSLIIIQNYIISSLTNVYQINIPNAKKCQTNLKDLAISNISQQSSLVEMQPPILGLIYSDTGLGRCTSPEYLTFQRQPKIWSDFYELGQLEMLNIPGNEDDRRPQYNKSNSYAGKHTFGNISYVHHKR